MMTFRMIFKLQFLLLILFFTTFAFAQNWKAIPLVSQKILDNGNSGGEGCQWPQAIEIDHTDGTFLLFGTDVGGIYRSTNGGKMWEPCNIGYDPRGNCGFAIDPNNNKRALAIGANSSENRSHGIYLTKDQASSWKHVYTEQRYSGYRNFKDKVAFDKSSYDKELGYSKIAYWSNPVGGLFKSIDGGETWNKIQTDFGDCVLKVSPENGTVYLGNNSGFYRSTDGGVSTSLILSGEIVDISVVYTRPSTVCVTTKNILYFSDDNGATFAGITSTSFPKNIITLQVSPSNPNKMVVCNNEGDYSKPIYYSADGGITWQKAAINNANSFMPFNGRTHEFAWHPVDENKVWAFGGDWITSSANGGKNFEWDANGYNGILVGGKFNFNISNPDLLYVASQDYNGAFTNNGGNSWIYCNASGLGWGGFTYGAYAASENVLVTQVSESGGAAGLLTMSRNGGQSFSKTNIICNGMQVGCGDAKDPNIIYFSDYYSKDLGQTWQKMDVCQGVLIASLFGEKEVYGANATKVVVSKNKGDYWEDVVNLPNSVTDIAIDHIANRLYIVTAGDRLFQFENGNLTEITLRIPGDQYNSKAIQTVAVDPNDPKIVYVAGAKNVYKSDASVKRSVDGGLTWEIITPNIRTNKGDEIGDGANEVFAIRVNPATRELWGAGSCYGIWKEIPDNKMTIQMTVPKSDTTYIYPDSVTFVAEVAQNVNPILKVEFFNGDELLATDTAAPFQFTWKNIDLGSYEVFTKATDKDGNTAFSGTIPVKMLVSKLPVASIVSPENSAEFEYNSTIEIIAEASDPDGTIAKVEFFNGETKLGEDTEIPYNFELVNAVEGKYSITAKATDNTNQSVISIPLKFTVKGEGGAIFYFEDFNDGLAQNWVPTAGTWGVVQNQFRNSTTDGGVENCIYEGTTFADYTFSAKAKPDWGNKYGVIFNYIDSKNYYLVELAVNPKTAYLKRILNGSETILKEAPYLGGGQNVYVKIEVKNDGKTTTVKISDQIVFNQIPTTNFTFGKIGLYTWWNPLWFDDVQVDAKGKDFFTGIELIETNSGDLKIYPNPATGHFFVELNQSKHLPNQVEIFNLSGKMVYSEIISGNLFSVATQKWGQRGLYIVKIVNDEFSVQKKIIIQ